MRRILVLGALALFTISAMAQDKPAAKAPKPDMKKDQSMQGGMPPAPKPSPEMEKLTNMFAGKWAAVVKTEAMEGMPASQSKGTATFVKGPGGMSLIEDFQTTGGMGPFRGHGVTYWDDEAKNYSGIWCDTMSPKGCEAGATSNWEGDKIVGYMEMKDKNGMTKYRMTYSDIKPNSVTFTMEAPNDTGEYKPMMTILYTRAAPMAKPAAAKP